MNSLADALRQQIAGEDITHVTAFFLRYGEKSFNRFRRATQPFSGCFHKALVSGGRSNRMDGQSYRSNINLELLGFLKN